MTDERYRAVITWKKLRPYYPDTYVQDALVRAQSRYGAAFNNPERLREITDSYEKDKHGVGWVFTTIFDNGGDYYRTAKGARMAVAYHTKHHPFCSIYGDGQDSTEIQAVVVQKAEMVLEWKEVGR
jgi:hypothetical protein